MFATDGPPIFRRTPKCSAWPVALAASLLLTCAAGGGESSTVGGSPDFEREVAPIFRQHCLRCHQPGHKQGDLSLATADDLTAGEYVVRGKPDESHLVELVTAPAGGAPAMPKEGTPLSAAQTTVLRRWIAAGAPWPAGVVLREASKADKTWWSLQPLKVVEPPMNAADQNIFGDANWSRHPIDRFVLAKLREKGLEPSPPADPATLCRRVYYDLTGLPPTPDELAQFIDAAGQRPASPRFEAAYAKLVDKLLASPRYGEHWGRHWLDVVRFGESRGFERNQIIDNLWPFRDYVIRSFNDDKPFDEFIREHLAGDVFGKDRPEIEIGSAFLTAGPYDDVGNQDPVAKAQIRADTLDEMIRTTGEAFLGLTIGCARCHHHKFDPITQADYYALYAVFAGTEHGERTVAAAEARKKRSETLKPWESRREKLIDGRKKLEDAIASRAKTLEAEAAASWRRPRHSRYGTEERFAPVRVRFMRLTVEGTDGVEAKRTFGIDEFEIWTAGDSPKNVASAAAGAKAEGAARDVKDFQGAYAAALTIDGKFGERWLAAGNQLTITLAEEALVDRINFSSDRLRALGTDNVITTFVGEYVVEASRDGKAWMRVADSYDREPATPALKEARLRKLAVSQDDAAKLAELNRQLAEVDRKIAAVPPLPTWWVGKHVPAPGPFRVFVGGDPQKPAEQVVVRSLSALDDVAAGYRLDAKSDEGRRREALADWIASPANPLTPRVLANRVWHYHFGCGLVDTPSDFGYMGGRPTHPELLDFLAAELQAGAWRLKSLHRLILTSQTYRQAADWREAAARIDGSSRFLWRFPPRRLSAEELRDSMLAVAGKLDLRVGGPGFRLYEYQQDNVATYVPLDRHGPETFRRAVYHQSARATRIDLMTEFDCPDNALPAPRRAATTTPLQALTLMNHSFTLEMATAMAERLEGATRPANGNGAVDEQIRSAYRACFGRAPDDAESSAAASLVESHGWRAFCRAMLNANEFAFIR